MRYLSAMMLSFSLVLIVFVSGCGSQRSDDTSIESAMALLDQGKIEEGERRLRSRLEKHPTDRSARLLLGRVVNFDGRPDEAVIVWKNGLNQSAQDAQLLIEIGRVRMQQGHTGTTIVRRRGTVTIQPNSDKASEEEFKQKHFALAAEAFEQALQLAPENKDAALALASAYSQLKKHKLASNVWRRLHDLSKDNAELALGLAQSLAASGESDEAAQMYKKALEANPRLHEAHLGLAEYQESLGKIPAADESRSRASFYSALPAFTRLTYSAENVATLNQLSDPDEVQRLIDDPSDRATDFLAALCWSHPHNKLETLAFESLEKRGSSATPLVRQLFEDAPSTCTIRSTARILARQKDPGLFEHLLQLLPSDTRFPGYHMDIAGALDELGDPRAVEPLVVTLNPSDRTPTKQEGVGAGLHDRTSARARAAMALGRFDVPAARQALATGLEHSELGPYCAAALYRLTHDAKYVETIYETIVGNNRYAAFVIAEYMRQVPTPDSQELVQVWDETVTAEEGK